MRQVRTIKRSNWDAIHAGNLPMAMEHELRDHIARGGVVVLVEHGGSG